MSYWAEKVLHFFPGLFSTDFLLSDLFSVLLRAFSSDLFSVLLSAFSSDFLFRNQFCGIVALCSLYA